MSKVWAVVVDGGVMMRVVGAGVSVVAGVEAGPPAKIVHLLMRRLLRLRILLRRLLILLLILLLLCGIGPGDGDGILDGRDGAITALVVAAKRHDGRSMAGASG